MTPLVPIPSRHHVPIILPVNHLSCGHFLSILVANTFSHTVRWYLNYHSTLVYRCSHSIHPARCSQKIVSWLFFPQILHCLEITGEKPELLWPLLKTFTDWAASKITLLPTKLLHNFVQLRNLFTSHKPTLIIPTTQPPFSQRSSPVLSTLPTFQA